MRPPGFIGSDLSSYGVKAFWLKKISTPTKGKFFCLDKVKKRVILGHFRLLAASYRKKLDRSIQTLLWVYEASQALQLS